MIIDGKEIAVKIENEIRSEIDSLRKKLINPSFALIQIGEEKASESYAKNITKKANLIDIYVEHHKLPSEISEQEAINTIKTINARKDIHGILIELPLPPHLEKSKILEAVAPEKDIDGFHPVNIGKLLEGNPMFVPATAQAILETVKSVIPSIEGRHTVIIGRSIIVGKPTALLFLQENATVTVCHSKTRNLPFICQQADILIVSTGRPLFVGRNFIKPGAVVIDVGINRINGKIVGDVNFEEVKDYAGWITPVPGGIGILTTLMLLRNVVRAAKAQNKIL